MTRRLFSLIICFLGLICVASVAKEVYKKWDVDRTLPVVPARESTGEQPVEKRRLVGQDPPFRSLRIAVFGSGNAWGVGLDSRFKAYPYLLSDTVENFAHTSEGPNYFSVCTQTVVGDDDVFDVIIFDYWLRHYEGLDELVRRLRQRYPNAIMIFVRAWLPVHFKRSSSEGSTDIQSLDQWKAANDLKDAPLHVIIKALQNDTGYWFMPTHDAADTAIQEIARSVKGHVFTFSLRETGKQTIIDFLGYYDDKHHSHVSELGHQAIAHGLNFVIKRHLEGANEADQVNTGISGNWGRGDSCHMWFFSGATDLLYSDSIHMNQFDAHNGLFALELTGSGWIVIENTLEHSELPTRTLYLCYLTDQSEVDLLDAQVDFGGLSFHLRTFNDIDPRHDIRTIPLGQVGLGPTNITVTTIEGTGNQPFRLIGFLLTNEISVPDEWGFGPTHG